MSATLWNAAEAAVAVGAECAAHWTAGGVAIDSRMVKPGDLFVAIVGDSLDGHDYVKNAFEAGAVAALVHGAPAGLEPHDARLLHVPDTLAGLEALARAARARSAAKVAAVTGSVGKTGTKEMLRRCFSALGLCHASEGNLNNHWGAPLSLARLPASAEFAVFELGMNHAGEIRPLALLTRPDVAIVTRIAAAHTAFFPNLEAVADAKAEIFEGLGPAGVMALNADDPLTPRLRARAKALGRENCLTFGRAESADIRLLDLDMDERGSRILADVAGRRLAWRLGAPGAHWAMNSLAVVAAIHAVGADVASAAEALAEMSAPVGRGARRHIAAAGGGFDLIDESYNASPAAVRAAFETLALAEPAAGGRRVVVLGDMLELGEQSAEAHAGLARDFVETKLDRAHAAGPESRRFIDALPEAARGRWAADAGELADGAAELAQPGDVVLVKGSLGMGMARVVKALQALGASGGSAAHAV